MVIQPHCQFRFLAGPVLGVGGLQVSLDGVWIFGGYSLLGAGLWWFCCSLGLGSGGFAGPVCLCWAGCGGGGLLGFVLK